jgi:hypothetical protein
LIDIVLKLVAAILATPFVVYVAGAARPWRRLHAETWWNAYFRLYWNPGSALVIGLFFWTAAIDIGPFRNSGAVFYAAGAVWLAVLAVAARDDRALVLEERAASGK